MAKVKVSESVTDSVSEWVTRSPIELFWTAKNLLWMRCYLHLRWYFFILTQFPICVIPHHSYRVLFLCGSWWFNPDLNEIAGRNTAYFPQCVILLLPFRHISIISSIIFSDFAIPSFGGAEQLVQLGGGGPTQWDTPFNGTKGCQAEKSKAIYKTCRDLWKTIFQCIHLVFSIIFSAFAVGHSIWRNKRLQSWGPAKLYLGSIWNFILINPKLYLGVSKTLSG